MSILANQAILTASKSYTQTYTALGNEVNVPLTKTLVFPFCNALVFKNGLKLVKDTDFTFVNMNGTDATASDRIVVGVHFETALQAGDVISIESSHFGGEYVDLESIKDFLRQEGEYGGFPLGTLFSYSGKDVPTGCLACDGQTITGANATYPQFYAWVLAHAPTKTLAEYSAYMTAHGNKCGYYGVDIITGTVRLPSIPCYIKSTTSANEVGSSLEPGLPNIEGYDQMDWYGVHAGLVANNADPNCRSGCFTFDGKRLTSGVYGGPNEVNNNSGPAYRGIAFDASKSNPLYGNSETVTPDSIVYRTFVKVYNCAEVTSYMHVGEVINALSNKVNDDTQLLPYGGSSNSGISKFLPSFMSRDKQFICPHPTNHRGFIIKAGTFIAMDTIINGLVEYTSYGTQKDIVFDAQALLDTGSLAGGKDYYIYLAKTRFGVNVVVSLNSTFPNGSTAQDSRKIGGFHTLSSDIVVPADHWLYGYTSADILPASFWDLSHRPTCQSEGMVYIYELAFWADIYLQSGTGKGTASVFGGTITDTRYWSSHVEDMFMVGKELLSDAEFACAAEGSNQQTNIAGSADPGTTGGHKDTAGRSMISNYGLQDCCGVMWQWLNHTGCSGGSAWSGSDNGKGCVYNTIYSLLGGGYWDNGSRCGSRCRDGSNSRLTSDASIGGRGRARSR